MDLFDVVRSCFRRWYVVLPLLLIAAWFAHDIYTSVKPVYYSNAVVGLAAPNIAVCPSARRNGCSSERAAGCWRSNADYQHDRTWAARPVGRGAGGRSRW